MIIRLKHVYLLRAVLVFCAVAFPLYQSKLLVAQEQDKSEQAQVTEDLRQSQKVFTNEIRPLLENSCAECHWGEDSDAGFDLEPFTDVSKILDSRIEWQNVLRRVSKKQMPPEDAEPLRDQDRQKIVEWIDELINNLDCKNTLPGTVTIRRLNRTEYRNTIRDLTGIDFEPAADFPGDDVGYGFDNIGDVLSLPPILMEKYLAAAEQILEEAIVDPSTLKVDEQLVGADFPTIPGSHYQDEFHLLSQTGTMATPIHFQPGTYHVSVEAFGDQAGDEPARMAISLNDQQQQIADVHSEFRKPSTHEFRFTVEKAGKQNLQLTFTNDYYNPKARLNDRDRNLNICSVNIKGPIGVDIELPESHRKIFVTAPGKEKTERKAASEIIRHFANRAFRRRATSDEVGRIHKLYQQARDDGETFENGLKFALQAALVSPNFLYKVETPPPPNGQPYELPQFELATSLSYYLWSSMPDEELFVAAGKRTLDDRELYRAQVRRMLASPKANSIVENFAEQWLQLRVLKQLEPDADLFPGCNEEMLADMATETKMVFADLLRRDGSILELLDSDHSFLNERLAGHYGIQGVSGPQFRKVSLTGSRRGGILTQASILTLTSNPNRTSPVKRGKWIMENLLGEEAPPALPDAAPLKSQEELGGSLRERMEQHRTDPNCASCHQKMDQLGFALENFDAVGRWRDRDEGEPIDTSASLPDGTKFDGAAQLQAALQTDLRDQFLMCITEKMLIYALGRGLTYSDQCAVDKIIEQASQQDYRISEFIIAVAESEPFKYRSRKKIKQ